MLFPASRYASFPLIAVLLLISSCKDDRQRTADSGNSEPENVIPSLGYTYYKAYPHDTSAFIEGLLVHNGSVFESTGSPQDMPTTRSIFGIVDLQSGEIDVKGELDRNRYFGEGITILNDKLYQLTYQTKVGFIYDAKTFRKEAEFIMPGVEGWGLTTDSTHLIMSEGTHRLYYIDPATMKTVKVLEVQDNMGKVNYLNELEYVEGYIYANRYGTNLVMKIDPATGKVVGRVDFTRLAAQAHAAYPGSLEMNGIAYNPETNRFLVTGKMWPFIFEVTIP